MQSLVNFLKFSAPYIVKNMSDVEEVSSHDLESLKNLIIEMFFDFVNVIEKK